MKTEKPDFQKHAGTFISQLDKTHSAGWRLDNYSLINAIGGICDAVYEKHVVPLQSRVSELERENKDLRKVFLSYQRTIQRLQGEVETLRTENKVFKSLVLTPEHLDKNSTGE